MTEIYLFQNPETNECRFQVHNKQHIRMTKRAQFNLIAIIQAPQQEFKRRNYFDAECSDPIETIKKQGC